MHGDLSPGLDVVGLEDGPGTAVDGPDDGSEVDAEPSDVAVAGLGVAESDAAPSLEVASLAGFFVPLEVLRSILAQPEPLKWNVGATKALRIAAPHTGHPSGPAAWMPCITSVRWPLAQTYS